MNPRVSSVLLAVILCAPGLLAQGTAQSGDNPAPASAPPPQIYGKVADGYYTSPTGLYKVRIPVLSELGGNIMDTLNVVTFEDDFSTHVSIGAFPLSRELKWEYETRGAKEFLIYFFTNIVMPDFVARFPGASYIVLRRPALPNSPAIPYRSKSRVRHRPGDRLSRARCRAGHRTNAPESRERLMNGFHSCKPRGRLSNSSGHRPVLHLRHHTVDTMRGKAGKHASAKDAVFDSHQDVFHFLITLVGLSGLKWSLALKRRVLRPEPVDRFLLVRENFARVH